MTKDRSKRKEKLTQAGLLHIAQKNDIAATHTQRNRKLVMIVGGIVLICIGIGIGVWVCLSLFFFPPNSLWKWVPPDTPMAVSLDMSQLNTRNVSALIWGKNTNESLIAHADTWLHSVFDIPSSVPIVQGKEVLVLVDAQTSAIVLGISHEPQALDTFITHFSRGMTVQFDSDTHISYTSSFAWFRPSADILLFANQKDTLLALVAMRKDRRNSSLKPRFSYNPLTHRSPFLYATITPEAFSHDSYLGPLVRTSIGTAQRIWMVASSEGAGMKGMISARQNSTFRSLIKTFVMRDGMLGVGITGNVATLSHHPAIKRLVAGAAVIGDTPYFHALMPGIFDTATVSGLVAVTSLNPPNTLVVIPDADESFDFSLFEERIRVILARSVPQEEEIILPDGSKARQLRASDRVFQWVGLTEALPTGEKVVIRSLPDNPMGIRFAYARIETQPPLLAFAPSPKDIVGMLSSMNAFAKVVEQARAYPESVDIMISPTLMPFVQGIKSIHTYQRSPQSDILFDIELHSGD